MIRRALYAMAAGAVVAALIIGVSPGRAQGQPAAPDTDCADVEIVFARGTFEPPGVGKVGEAFAEALRQRLPGRVVGVHAVRYPASVQFDLAAEGVLDASNQLREVSVTCPATEIVLGGYSQGAAVSGYVTSETVPAGYALTALPAEAADNVAAVVLFGKPAPAILTLLRHDAPPISIGSAFAEKTLELCAPGDPVCAPGAFDRSAHSAYVINGMADRAAQFVADRLSDG